MTALFNPCSVKVDTRTLPVFVEVEFKNGRLSLTGVVGPKGNGDADGGCGQIDSSLREYAKDVVINPEWTRAQYDLLLNIWDKWHLNDMHAECEHQEALGWTWKTHPSEACPVCGYKLGHGWTRREVPASVIEAINSMPQSKVNMPGRWAVKSR